MTGWLIWWQERNGSALSLVLQLCVALPVFLGWGGWPARRRPLVPLVLLAIYLMQLGERYDSLAGYAFMALRLGLFTLLVLCWTGRPFPVSFCLGLCCDLVTSCCDTIFRFAGVRLIGVDYLRTGEWYGRLGAGLLVAAVELLFFLVLRLALPELPRLQVPPVFAAIMLTMAVPYFLVSSLTFWLPLRNDQLTFAVPVLLFASCVAALFSIVSSASWLSAERSRQQEQQRRHLLELQQHQFRARKASEEAVRRQYHDMKNLLLCLERADGTEQARRQVHSLLDNIRPYEQQLETGCEAADAVLSQKLALCRQKGILCTVCADGRLLQQVDPLDLSCLLGNAMDNAIEACEALDPDQPRVIQLRCIRKGQFLVLHLRNPVPAGREAEKGARTSKPDKENHGFGLRSMRLTAEKYGGQISAEVHQGEFLLTILLPLPKQPQEIPPSGTDDGTSGI